MTDTTTLIPHLRLQFNIEHPSLEDCYSFGYESALSDIEEMKNPFKQDTCEYEQWQEGWWDGFYGEKPLYEIEAKSDEVVIIDLKKEAVNDASYIPKSGSLFGKVLRITGAIAATAVVSYQIIDLVA
jgi:hypothetical protein